MYQTQKILCKEIMSKETLMTPEGSRDHPSKQNISFSWDLILH